MPLLNKALVPSSLASVLLHGVLVAGVSFSMGNKLAQNEGNVRLNIRLTSFNTMLEPVQESSSHIGEQETLPEENKAEVAHEPQPESLSQPVVSSPKPAKEKVVNAEKPPEPAKSESEPKAPGPELLSDDQPDTLPGNSSPVTDDSSNESALIAKQASAALSESVNKVDPIQLWLSELQQRINQHRRYPRQAVKRGLEGGVQIKAVINVDGSLASAEVISGHRSFHSNSLRSLKQALPLPPPAGTRQPVSMVFTIHYKLE